MAIKTDRSIFFHIPKTGGIWVKTAMKAAGLRYSATSNVTGSHPFNLKRAHATPDIVVPRALDGRLSFTFVRRPVAWYRSYWSFRSRKGARRDEKFPADGLWSDNFDQFVNNLLDAYPGGFVSTLFQYYTGENGEKVGFVGTQENLVDDLVKVLHLADEDFDEAALRATAPTNRSPGKWKRRADKFLTAGTLLRVMDAEKWIQRFYNGN